ncbi:MAG: hypothetical protein Q7R95_11270 [bacterium]|nr:hypothetical protein [bacterium]
MIKNKKPKFDWNTKKKFNPQTYIEKLVDSTQTVEEALNKCINQDIIFVSGAIRRKFNLTTQEYYAELQKFRFI